MTQGIREAIQELQSQEKHHLDQAARLTRAIAALQGLVAEVTPTAKAATKPAKRKKTKAKPAAAKTVKTKAPAKTRAKGKRKGKASLATALVHVLSAHKGNGAGVSAKQLYGDIHKAGFKFGGTNEANNMNYLYKTLRKGDQFKRVSDGMYALA
jgi:hypothetical protein